MNYKDYGAIHSGYADPFYEIGFKKDGGKEYSELIRTWWGDFDSIAQKIPLNSEDMFDGLACHYHVDTPWRRPKGSPWEVDEIETTLNQLLFVKDYIKKGIRDPKRYEDSENYDELHAICLDLCQMFEKAKAGLGKVYITYDYE